MSSKDAWDAALNGIASAHGKDGTTASYARGALSALGEYIGADDVRLYYALAVSQRDLGHSKYGKLADLFEAMHLAMKESES